MLIDTTCGSLETAAAAVAAAEAEGYDGVFTGEVNADVPSSEGVQSWAA